MNEVILKAINNSFKLNKKNYWLWNILYDELDFKLPNQNYCYFLSALYNRVILDDV